MAAHILTGLTQVVSGEFTVSQMRAALNLSTWTEDLAWKDWKTFSDLTDSGDFDGIVNHAKSIIEFYRILWNLLDKPQMRESWNERRFAGNYKRFNLLLSTGKVFTWRSRHIAGAILSFHDTFSDNLESSTVLQYKSSRARNWKNI